MNETMDTVIAMLNDAWQDIELAINTTYDEGYTSVTYKLKRIQLDIENLEHEIREKEYDDDL